MKKIIVTTLTVFALIAFSNTSYAQTNKTKQEVTLEELNGVNILTVTTTENGKANTKVYKGNDAITKLAELEKANGKATKTEYVTPDGTMKFKIAFTATK